MGFLSRIFGKKKIETVATGSAELASPIDPSDNPGLIKVRDAYGRELFITKQAWKDSVLIGNIESARDDPDRLCSLIVGAIEDGFATDVIPFAEHLALIDPIATRGATILGIVYMKSDRFEDAERVLVDCLAKHGDDGTVLTNLAKIYSHKGDNAKVESTLWRGLEADPNQENGLHWYAVIHRELGGESSAIDAYRRVAALPQSWRAQLSLANALLGQKRLDEAMLLYETALSRAGVPSPTDLLSNLSGDLGRNGYLEEAIQLVGPRFLPEIHGIQVGNNLIKANLNLGHIDAAKSILEQLYSQKRSDWQDTLQFWDHELSKAALEQKAASSSETNQIQLALFSMQGPLWAWNSSLFSNFLPSKREDAPRIAIICSTVLFSDAPDKPVAQLSDSPGRLSRVIPIALSERIYMTTNATSIALIPWVQQQGFALFGHAYSDSELFNIASQETMVPFCVISISVDATQPTCSLKLRMLRTVDTKCVGECEVNVDPNNPGPSVEELAKKLDLLIGRFNEIVFVRAPTWFSTSCGNNSSGYLLRLEQQLAITCMTLDYLKGGGLSGEREILDGTLRLCLNDPTNAHYRMLFAETVRRMHQVRPRILAEFQERVQLLQNEHPIANEIGQAIQANFSESFSW